METTTKLTGIRHFLQRFFPLHLIFSHLRHNLISILIWIFFFLVITDRFGYAFGVPILFYSPEYLGEVSPVSFALLGFGFGGFVMAFNTYSYIKLGRYYPFLVLVTRPFFKFCKNNSLIPVAFVITYLINMAHFQVDEEFASETDVLLFSLSFVGGMLLFIVLSILYFFPMSRRSTIPDVQDPEEEENESDQPVQSVFRKKRRKWYAQILLRYDKTYYYWGRGFKIQKCRSVRHLDADAIEGVLARNRINTSLFELMTITTFIILGLFSDFKLFETPAAMSIVLLITTLLMLFSAFQSWFGRWSYILLFLIIGGMNLMSLHTRYFTFKNYAYGLNYGSHRPVYSIRKIEQSMQSEEAINESYNNYLAVLENWKQQTGEKRPKLIIINTSGGGSRSALWTFGVLQKTDQELHGKLSRSIQMMTGASGGMIGASYFREVLLRSRQGEIEDLYAKTFRDNLGKDLLNKLSFSASTRDMFFRYQKFEYNNHQYPKDRGYAFEEQLHENTDHLMDHSLGYYAPFEQDGSIPTMIFSPTIVNDGRRLLISSQSLCFLANNDGPSRATRSFENIDFQSFFSDNKPQEIRFSSVMRASSTFPFVMPMVTMPSTPEVQLMDAGIRDNYGGKVTMEFLYMMKDWIRENTSGVVIIQIRDTKKILDNEIYRPVSLIDKLTLPFGNMYKNFPRTQDFDQEQLFTIGSQQFTFPVDLVSFNLREDKNERISLSWHLTSQEKLKIENAFDSKSNQHALTQLKRLLNH